MLRLRTGTRRFTSYAVLAVFMNESIWPEGAYVRWWSEKRRSSSGSDHNDSSNEGVVVQTVTMTDAQPIIDI